MQTASGVALLLCFVGSYAHSQEASGQILAELQAKQTRIAGNVSCDDTHLPARGAIVYAVSIKFTPEHQPRISTSGMRMGTVALDGTYEIKGINPGDYVVSASYLGYISLFKMLQGAEQDSAAQERILSAIGPVTVKAFGTAESNVLLKRGAVLSGTVSYDDGAPAVGVTLDLVPLVASSSHSGQKNLLGQDIIDRSSQSHTLTTDYRGQYRLIGIPEGTYLLSAVQALSGTGGDETSNLVTTVSSSGSMLNGAGLKVYVGNTFFRQRATPLNIASREERDAIDIVIPTRGYHRVSGVVVTHNGGPAESRLVSLISVQDSSLTFAARTNPEGLYSFAVVPSGDYMLKVDDVITPIMVLNGKARNPIDGGDNIQGRSLTPNTHVSVIDEDVLAPPAHLP